MAVLQKLILILKWKSCYDSEFSLYEPRVIYVENYGIFSLHYSI